MPRPFAGLISIFLLALAQPVLAQSAPSITPIAPLRFESWQPETMRHAGVPAADKIITVAPEKKNEWLIGGVMGAAAGIVFCTAVSTAMNDSASGGLSFCPLDSNAIMAGAGFVLGAAIGLAF